MDDFKVQFGRRLRAARKSARLSQDALSQRTGIPQDQISHYERGNAIPMLQTFERLVVALAIDPAYFFSSDESIVSDSPLDQESRDLFRLASSLLPSSALDFLIQFIEMSSEIDAQRRVLIGEDCDDERKRMARLLEHHIRNLSNVDDRNLADESHVSLRTLAAFTVIAVYSMEFGGYRVVPDDLSRHFDPEKEAV